MLRMVLGQGRRRNQGRSDPTDDNQKSEDSGDDFEEAADDPEDVLEPWIDWIRRVTHNAEENLQRLKNRTWIEQARTRKWRFAADLFSSSGDRKWSHIALQWNPQVHFDAPRPAARRKPTRPNLRWTDELRNYAKEHLRPELEWNDVCADPDFWKNHEHYFITRNVS